MGRTEVDSILPSTNIPVIVSVFCLREISRDVACLNWCARSTEESEAARLKALLAGRCIPGRILEAFCLSAQEISQANQRGKNLGGCVLHQQEVFGHCRSPP